MCFYRCCLKCSQMIEKTSCVAFTISVKSTLFYSRFRYFIELCNQHVHADRLLISLETPYFLRVVLLPLECSTILTLMQNFRSKGLIFGRLVLSTKNRTKKPLLLRLTPALLHKLSLYLKGLIHTNTPTTKSCFQRLLIIPTDEVNVVLSVCLVEA
jgi:hypothetical protein